MRARPEIGSLIPAISIILFAVACCLPALEFRMTRGGNDVMWGANILAVGWSGIFAGVFAWYANPLWLFGLAMLLARKPRLAAVAAVLALLLGCTTFSLFGTELPADEGNVTHMTLVATLPGCYLWLASLAALLLSGLTGGKLNLRSPGGIQ